MSRVFVAPIIGQSAASGAQVIDGSLKFDSAAKNYLEKDSSSEGNRKTWTWSCWVKKPEDEGFSEDGVLFEARIDSPGSTDANIFGIRWRSNGRIGVYDTGNFYISGTREFRDTNAFYHLVLSVDTTQASNNISLYVNGDLYLQGSYTQNSDTRVNSSAATHRIGARTTVGSQDGLFLSSQLSQTYFIDGQALGPGYFGFTDPLTNTWRPKKYTGTFAIASGTPSVSNGGLVIKADGASINGTFVVNGGVKTWTSPDGVTWTRNGDGRSSAAAKYLAVGGAGTALRTFYPDAGSGGFTFYMYNGGGEFDGSSSPFTLDLSSQTYLPSQTSSFGGNGFYLSMDGNSPIGEDESGNGNDFTPVNFGGSVELDKATGALPILNTTQGGTQAGVGVRTDAYASNLVLAVPFIGNTDDVSHLVNSSQSQKADTNSGSTATTTLSNFYSGSRDFDGSNDTCSFASVPACGAGDWTVEFWLYSESSAQDTVYRRIVSTGENATSAIQIGHIGTAARDGGYITYTHSDNSVYAVNTSKVTNRWAHIAVVRESGSVNVYTDGIKGTTADSDSNNKTGTTWYVSGYGGATDRGRFNGKIQDFRVYPGIAKYTEDFIPASTNPDILPDTPSGVSGGSKLAKITDGAVSFDGTGDYLSLANSTDTNFGSGDFTWECFAYFHTVTGSISLMGQWENSTNRRSWLLQVNDGKLQSYISPDGTSSGLKQADSPANYMAANRWYHLAVTRSGNNMRLFIDGKLITTTDLTGFTVYSNTDDGFSIGSQKSSASNLMNGFISNARIIKGTALYTSDFTPSTAPLTNVTNTKLLCCQSNTSATAAAVAPANEPFSGAGGAEGGGTTSDYLQVSSSGHSDFSVDGDFTFEWWHYRAAANANNGYMWTIGDSNTATGIELYWGSSGSTLKLFTNGSENSVTATAATGWHHYAVVRSGNTIKVYYDGTEGASVSNSSTFSGNVTIGGEFYNGSITGGMHGPMSQFRFVKGTAVYTSNFTAPTTALTAITNTKLLTLQGSTITDASGTNKTITVNGTVTTVGISKNGDAAATTFNPFITDIHAVRGQETGYPTWNPLSNGTNAISDGNLTLGVDSSSGNSRVNCTMSVSSGKWYYECYVLGSGSNYNTFGVSVGPEITSQFPGGDANSWSFEFGEAKGKHNNSYSSAYTAIGAGDTFMCAFDLDTKKLWFGRNGIWQVGDPGSGTNAFYDISDAEYSDYRPSGRPYGAGSLVRTNFGQKPFKYAPPDGFQPINAANVRPETVITRPDQYVGVTTYSGNGGTKNIDVGHKPDFVWVKARDGSARSHFLYDSVRGEELFLQTDGTAGESALQTNTLSSFNDDGFTTGSRTGMNDDGVNYVTWTWKAGGNKNTFNIDDVGYANASDVNMSVGTLNSVTFDKSQNWTSQVSGTQNGTYPFSNMFNADGEATHAYPANGTRATFTPSPSFSNAKTVKVWYYGPTINANTFQLNGVNVGDQMPTTSGTLTKTFNVNGFTSWSWSKGVGGDDSGMLRIDVDGVQLVDSGVSTPNVPSIAPTGCSVGTKQGFSILKWTGTSANGTLSHGLTKSPEFVIVKKLTGTGNWYCYHSGLTDATKYIWLNSNSGEGTQTAAWNSTDPTSSVLHLGAEGEMNANENSSIAYLWHSVPGLQKFGKFIANSSTDGSYVELGFRPSIVWVKAASNAGDMSYASWLIADGERSPTNPVDKALFANKSVIETKRGNGSDNFTDNWLDILSNGFKIRYNGTEVNGVSGQTYIYCAWAEAPTFNLYGGQSNAR